MARTQRIEYEGAVYHVTARGNERREIFRDDADREHFLRVLGESVGRFEVRLYLFCLMANHIHLVVETPRANRNSRDIYEQAVVKTVAGLFRGNSTHLFGITRFGVPGIYIRAGSSQLNEVVWPQSPRTESGQVIPRIVVRRLAF